MPKKIKIENKIIKNISLTTLTSDLLKNDALGENLKINPELRIDPQLIDIYKNSKELTSLAKTLIKKDLKISVHGSFINLSPGAFDPYIRKASLKRIKESLCIAALFKPIHVVFHPCYLAQSYNHKYDKWLENSLDTWEKASHLASDLGLNIVFENTYETKPEQIIFLLKALNKPHCGFLFDCAHAHALGDGQVKDWISSTAPYLKALHLHDNHGQIDEHLALGEGNTPLADLQKNLMDFKLTPNIILETRRAKDFETSVKYLEVNWFNYFSKL